MVRFLIVYHSLPAHISNSPEDFTFRKSTSLRHPEPIYNVVPGDFTHDGKLDLLVMSQGTRSNQLAMSLYIALPEGGFGIVVFRSFP